MRDEHMDQMVDEYRHTWSGVPGGFARGNGQPWHREHIYAQLDADAAGVREESGGGRRVFMWANGPMEEMNHYTRLLAHYMSDPAKRGSVPADLRPARTAIGVSVHQTHAITAAGEAIRIQVRERQP